MEEPEAMLGLLLDFIPKPPEPLRSGLDSGMLLVAEKHNITMVLTQYNHGSNTINKYQGVKNFTLVTRWFM